ncbi:MAG: NAD-dependent epimerase/dehydratase family protein [Planctomycetota bacterium]
MPFDRLVIGCGYLGRRVADRWRAEGLSVAALTRNESRSADFRSAGLSPVVGDLLDRDSLAGLPEADVMLVAVGYDRTAGPSKRQVYVDGLSNLLEATAGRVGRVVYVSSTSVYGVTDGGEVNDDTEAVPGGEAGQICLDAERLFDEPVYRDVTSVVLRLAGIYGPDRLLRRAGQLRGGEPILGNPQAWLNLTHVDDAASAVIAAATHRQPRARYLISDDEPVRRIDYYGRLAEILGTGPPVFDASAVPRHAGGLGKRCVARGAREDLVTAWTFPTYREGLTDAVERSEDL